MAHQEDINKWVELHKDQIQSTAEALVVEDILAEKIAEMREQERRNALNIDPREDVRLNYFKGLKIKPHSQEILYPTKILKFKTKNIKKEIQHNYGDSDLVWFSNKINLDNKKNIKNVDKFTKSNFSGILKNTGVAYFTSEKKIKDLFKDFRILHLEEKIINRKLPKKHNNYYVSWNIVVSKKS